MNPRIIHDASWAAAVSIMEVIAPVLMDSEKNDCFQEILARVKNALETAVICQARENMRRNPSRN